MIIKLDGQLEIDRDRGVIYFHAKEPLSFGVTALRICGLPRPIPVDQFLDVTLTGEECNWWGYVGGLLTGENTARLRKCKLANKRKVRTNDSELPEV